MELVSCHNKKAVETAAAVLKNGGLIIYPTETCYGLGADALNPKAVLKVQQFKGLNRNKPISIAVNSRKMAEKYVVINELADNLYNNFLPGPLTVVSKSRGLVVSSLASREGTLGIRIPDYLLALKIIEKLARPITSTSANQTGRKSPYSLADIKKYVSKKRLALVNLFINAGKLPLNPVSTVVDTTFNELKIIRQGRIKIAENNKNTFISNSEEETKKIALKIFNKYKNYLIKKPLLFALQGELGSGKTQFAKGIGLALGIRENIKSPTFTLIHEYPFSLNGRKKVFYHLDAWRLENGEELFNLGLEKMLKSGNVIAVEWLEKTKTVLEKISRQKKAKIIWLEIKYLPENKRKIVFKG
jgi:L-threonylcarbamoyladenylate synthase